jgi:hypothetical protein
MPGRASSPAVRSTASFATTHRLAVQASGHKSAIVRFRRPDGRTAKLTLKGTPFTLAALRHAAAAAMAQLEDGIDPSPPRVSAPAVAPAARDHSVEHWATVFLERHARRKNRPSYARASKRIFERLVLPIWGKRTVHEIHRRDVIELVENIATDRPYLANRTRAALSKFFNWAVTSSLLRRWPESSARVRKNPASVFSTSRS